MFFNALKHKWFFIIKFIWYDFWIGFYFDKHRSTLYFCPLPMMVFIFQVVQ